MQVLTFTSLFPNAADPNFGIFIFQRTSHLAQRAGNSVEVVAPLPYAPEFLKGTAWGHLTAIPATEVIGNLRVHHPRYPLLPKVSMPLHGLLMYAGCKAYVRNLHQQHCFDCIDAHYVFPDGMAAVLLGRSLGIPVTVTARGSDIHTFREFGTVRPQIKWVLRHAAAVVAVSDSLASMMHELEPSLQDLPTIGNGVDSGRFYPEDRQAARAALGLNPQDTVVVSVAALKHVKGPDLLVRAASLLKQCLAHCKVLFVGAGPELGKLQQLTKQLGCADVCQFVGPVPNEQLRTFFSAADVSCLASRGEGWPNVILESLACGTPVLATRVGAAPHLLANDQIGIIVDGTPEAICAGLSRALQQGWNRQAISAFAHVHTWENVAASVEAVLKQAAKPRLES
jgi:glycosyltransferase involved in cell wall biosynthesis